MKRKTLSYYLLATMFAWLPLTSVVGQNEFYVSPDGADTNSGTLEQPFQTLAKARDVVAMVISSMDDDITVYFKGGDYYFTEAVAFTSTDGGVNNHQIIYRAYEDEKPVFNGATKVTSWTKYDDNIYQAQLGHKSKLRSLIVNGTRAYMAHKEVSGKGDWGTYEIRAGEADWARISGSSADGIQYNTSDVPVLENPGDVEIWKSSTWNTHILCARDITTDGSYRVLKLQQPSAAIAFNQKWGGFSASGTHTLYNAFEFLDEPGEFYYNRTTNVLYYYPRSGEDMTTADVFAPKVSQLISIEGSSKTDQVSHISFEGISFAYTESELPKVGDSEGKSTVQAATWCMAYDEPDWHATAYRSYDAMPNMINVNNAHDIQFNNNTLKHIGNEGIGFINDASDCQFVGNFCYDIGGSAVQVGHPQHVYEADAEDYAKYSAEVEGVCRNILVENNVMYDMTTMFYGHAPVTAYFVDSLQVVKNHIQKCNYSAISVGWGWYDFDEESKPDNPTTTCRDNTLSYNRVYDCMTMLHDGGAFYTLGSQPNSTADGNYVKAATTNFQGVFHPDEGTAWYTGKDMVFEIARGQDNFELNTWRRKHDNNYSNIYSTSGSYEIGAPNCTVTDLHVVPYANWNDEALTIIRAAGVDSSYHDLLEAIPNIVFGDDKRYDTEGLIVDTVPLAAGARIEAEDYTSASGTKIEDCSDIDGIQDVGTIESGDWLMFSYVDLRTMNYLNLRLASINSGGAIQIRIDDISGDVIGTMDMPNTGGWQTWETVSASIDSVGGIHDVYLIFASTASYVGNINWLQFSDGKIKNTLAIITSDVYRVSENSKTIATVPEGILVSEFESNLELSIGATIITYQPDGTTKATAMESKCEVHITSEDGLTTSVYRVAVVANSSVSATDLEVLTYPNPFTDKLTISNASGSNIEIYSISGSLIFTSKIESNEQTFELDALLSGCYILKMTTPNGTAEITKVVKQ